MLPSARSLNLSTAVAATLYEALRQVAWRPDSAASEMGEKRDFRTPESG
jgi:tRNA C32,U32 (ribose-2'-O)-methylase TrmJ